MVKPKDLKRKEKDSIVQYQKDVIHCMKERNVGDVKSNEVTMIKELNITLPVLAKSWIELDKTVVLLEDDVATCILQI